MISNAVTLFRMMLILPMFYLLASEGPGWPALALFFVAGFLDVVDGKLARHFEETSRVGAMLDLIADRLLTFGAVAALLIAGVLALPAAIAASILVVRCLIVGSLGEALTGRAKLRDSRYEPFKIVISFSGLGLAMAPLGNLPGTTISAAQSAEILIILAAILASITIVDYIR
jgi:phosphatidylglycerophosphate synthase